MRFNRSSPSSSAASPSPPSLASSNFDGSIHVTDLSAVAGAGAKSLSAAAAAASHLPTQHLHTDKVLMVDWHPTRKEVLVSSGADGALA